MHYNLALIQLPTAGLRILAIVALATLTALGLAFAFALALPFAFGFAVAFAFALGSVELFVFRLHEIVIRVDRIFLHALGSGKILGRPAFVNYVRNSVFELDAMTYVTPGAKTGTDRTYSL